MSRAIELRAWHKIMRQMLDDDQISQQDGLTVSDLWNDPDLVWVQYTGLTDKNGVKIFEGDIIKGMNHMPVGSVIEVRFDSRVGGFAGFGKDALVYFIVNESKNIQVIGNIYEHPELTKKEGLA